jgi:hypothetical protein
LPSGQQLKHGFQAQKFDGSVEESAQDGVVVNACWAGFPVVDFGV